MEHEKGVVKPVRIEFGLLTSLFAVLILVYNPWTLSFKGEILSDIPFALFFTMAILLYLQFKKSRKRKLLYAILTASFIGFSMLIKGVGVVLLLGVGLDALIESIKRYKETKLIPKQIISFSIIIFSVSIVSYLLIDKVVFPAKKRLFHFLFCFV